MTILEVLFRQTQLANSALHFISTNEGYSQTADLKQFLARVFPIELVLSECMAPKFAYRSRTKSKGF